MSDDRWQSEDLPFLRALVVAEETAEPGEALMPGQIAATAGLPSGTGTRITARLHEAGYLYAMLPEDGAGRITMAMIRQVRERGRRAAGQWPSENHYQSLLDLLGQQIDEEQDAERKSRLVRFRDATLAIGRDLGTNVLATYLAHVAGVPGG